MDRYSSLIQVECPGKIMSTHLTRGSIHLARSMTCSSICSIAAHWAACSIMTAMSPCLGDHPIHAPVSTIYMREARAGGHIVNSCKGPNELIA